MGCYSYYYYIIFTICNYDNEVDDRLAKSISNTILHFLSELPWTDFASILRYHTSNLWSNSWTNLPANFTTKYKNIVLDTPN